MKFFIRTYGCQMNVRDSEAISSLLLQAGYEEASGIDDADILILNTCSVRDSAERKVEGYLWKLRSWKEERDEKILCLTGCMAQSYGKELLDKFPHLDIAAGTSAVSQIPQLIENVRLGYGRFAETEQNLIPYDDARTHLRAGQISAFIPVMRGCSMNCSYCIVPQVRGSEQSREPEEIIEEAANLAEQGVKEIFLLGQNIAAYGLNGLKKSDKSPFAKLLAKIAEIDKIKRIRFTSPHPASFNDALIKALCEIRKVCSGLHIPLQSGSDRILGLMSRGYTSSDYLKIIEKLLTGRPEFRFSTDIIVGFPGETDKDFNDTRRILNEVGFDQEFIFKYSKRKNTPAADMPDQIPPKTKEERNKILLDDLKERVIKINKSMIGSKVEILIESVSRKNNKRLVGKTSSGRTVVAEDDPRFAIGDFATVLIEDATLAALYGRII